MHIRKSIYFLERLALRATTSSVPPSRTRAPLPFSAASAAASMAANCTWKAGEVRNGRRSADIVGQRVRRGTTA